MLYDPADPKNKPAAVDMPAAERTTPGQRFRKKAKAYARYMRIKRNRLLGAGQLVILLIPFIRSLSHRP